MSSSIENIEKVLGAKRFGDRSAQIDWILTDSRSLCFPEETLFFALKTKRNDGHKYLPELYERGVRNFVVGELPADMKSFQDANFLQLANPLKGLQKLAEKHREQFQIPVIGIWVAVGSLQRGGGEGMVVSIAEPGPCGNPFAT